MKPINVARWRKYGHDRAYATGALGEKLGWIDLTTGVITITSDDVQSETEASLRDFAARLSEPRVTDESASNVPASPVDGGANIQVPAPASEPDPALESPIAASEPCNQTWTDLAENRPGEGVQAEADAAWEASKQGSKFFSFTNRYIFDVKTDERAWRVGAEGERAIGERLNKLRDQGWRVLHSIPVGSRGSDIDHVVVGPGGVFTINSKNHPGGKIWVAKYQMRVNGHVVPYLRNASHEATRASKLLSEVLGFEVPVRSCVVVLTGTIVPEVKIKEMPDDVMVLDRMDVPRWFKKRKPVLTAEQVEKIYDVARRSNTWV